MNRRDKLLKNDNTDKEKQVPKIRPDFGVSPETSSPKLSIEVVGDSIINGITPVRLSSKRKHRLRIKPYGGAVSEELVDHIRPTLRRTPDVIAIHIGTNNITNDACSSIQINLGKVRELATEPSPSSKIVLSYIILRNDKTNINVKVNRENEIIKQFCITNKLYLINNSHIKYQKLYGKKKLHLKDAGKSLLANNFIEYFLNM